MKIKFFNLYKQDKKDHPKIIKIIKKNIKKGDYILGNEVNKFEKNFSKFVGSKYAIGCANGTDALTIALKCLQLKSNSEVIVPAMTYCSTVFSVLSAGLKPILVDIKKNTPVIDTKEINKKITKNTKVILPVHLYGSTANIDEIKKIIKKYKQKIYIIDDCSQAHGAFDNNKKKIGSISDISCFSLYPGKNLGAYGDAGIITTNSKKYYSYLRKLRNLGSEKKFFHDIVGQNSRLDTLQASILNIKLKRLNKLNKKRQLIAEFYNKKIINKKIQKINYSQNAVYHQYVIIVKKRKEFIKYLQKKRIEYSFHYPFSINQLKVFKKKYKSSKYKNAETLANQGISIPIDPNLNKVQIQYIVNVINSF
jgi:dTDP-4-amino-4,6-dideoxygalactose transaminase